MRIFVKDFQAINTKTGPRVRFSVTVAEENGEPVMTSVGWTFDAARVIWLPSNRTSWGKYYPVIDASEKLLLRVQAVLESSPEVERILGPKVEGVEVTGTGNEVLNVELEA